MTALEKQLRAALVQMVVVSPDHEPFCKAEMAKCRCGDCTCPLGKAQEVARIALVAYHKANSPAPETPQDAIEGLPSLPIAPTPARDTVNGGDDGRVA